MHAVFCCQYACRPILMQYGLWDQIRVDQGKEWVLSLFVQERLAASRTSTVGPPHLQSTSTMVGIYCDVWQCGTFH